MSLSLAQEYENNGKKNLAAFSLLTPSEIRTLVFYPRGLRKLNVAIFTNYPKSAKKLAAKFNTFHIFGGKPIWQEIWSPKTSCGHETWRKGKRTPRWCARGEEKLAHRPIDGAEFRTRTIFDNVSVIRK